MLGVALFGAVTSASIIFAAASTAAADDLWRSAFEVAVPEPERASGYSVDDFARALRLPAPSKLSSSGQTPSLRRTIQSPLGIIVLRHPPQLAAVLGYSPVSAVEQAWAAAASAVGRLKIPFDSPLSEYEWNVIIVDDSPLVVSGSRVSSAYCHTALMGPPADIVIDGYRLRHPCDSTSASRPGSAVLVQSLIHEVGHGLEYRMLGKGFSRRQRWHGEGFASWFEAAGREELPFQQDVAARMKSNAKRVFKDNWRPYLFSGSPDDYAMSYALIASIADGRSPADLFRVYARMQSDVCSFEEAVERELGLTFEAWMAETKAFLFEERPMAG